MVEARKSFADTAAVGYIVCPEVDQLFGGIGIARNIVPLARYLKLSRLINREKVQPKDTSWAAGIRSITMNMDLRNTFGQRIGSHCAAMRRAKLMDAFPRPYLIRARCAHHLHRQGPQRSILETEQASGFQLQGALSTPRQTTPPLSVWLRVILSTQ